MAIDTSVPRTRRALLAGGIGGLAALVASALGRPLPASAADNEAVLVGGEYTATSVTKITQTSAWEAAIEGNAPTGQGVHGASESGYGIAGHSVSSFGVKGFCDGAAAGVCGRVFGTAGTGVIGYSGTGNDPTAVGRTGVYGFSDRDARSTGVLGRCDSGTGVRGQATTGRGLHGLATTGTAGYFATTDPTKGYALRASARVRFDRCAGVATILAPSKSVTVTPGIDLVSTSAVVATLQGSAGGAVVERVEVNALADAFTIHLTKPTIASVKVAWHVFG